MQRVTSTQEGAVVALEEVSNTLWKERELLEQLLFKLEEELALLRTGSSRWLAWGGEEIKRVLAQLERAEEARRIAWEALAADFGLPADAPLKAFINKAAFPWNSILTEHQRALNTTAREIEDTAADERLAPFGAQHATKALTWLRPHALVA